MRAVRYARAEPPHDLRRPPPPGLLCGLLPLRSARLPTGADSMAAPLLRPPGMPTPRTLAAGESPAGAPTPRGTLLRRLLRHLPGATPRGLRSPKAPPLETVVSVGPREGAQAAMLASPHAHPLGGAPPGSGSHLLWGDVER